MEEQPKLIRCNICNLEGVEPHEKDRKACVPCATEYFKSIRPPLTMAMEGLTPQEKSMIIKSVIKDDFEKKEAQRTIKKAEHRIAARERLASQSLEWEAAKLG